MQTFLPYPDFKSSAKSLDNKRLGKQRVECLQLLKALSTGPMQLMADGTVRRTPWYNHPACQMWRGFEQSLLAYGKACCEEWVSRGFKDTCHNSMIAMSRPDWGDAHPYWLGMNQFHAAHRSNLLRKDSKWYGQFKWTEPNDLPYYWPPQGQVFYIKGKAVTLLEDGSCYGPSESNDGPLKAFTTWLKQQKHPTPDYIRAVLLGMGANLRVQAIFQGGPCDGYISEQPRPLQVGSALTLTTPTGQQVTYIVKTCLKNNEQILAYESP